MGVWPGTASQEGSEGMWRHEHTAVEDHCLSGAAALPAVAAVTREDAADVEGSGVSIDSSGEKEIVSDAVVNGDVTVTAEDSSETIKGENFNKCFKCLKSSFRYRHDGFCGKCVQQKVIEVTEQERLDDVRCSKCDKPKFRGRNSLFCSDICDVTVETPVPTQPSPGHIYKETTEMEESEKKDKKEIYKKKKQEKIDKTEGKYIKQKKKKLKQEERERRRKEKQTRKLEKKNKKFGSAP